MRSIDNDLKEFEKVFKEIDGRIIPLAQAAALNKSQKQIVSRVATAVSKRTNIPAKVIKRRIVPLRAKGKRLGKAKTWFNRQDISVVSLKHRVTKKRGVTAAKRKFQRAFKADGSKGYGRYLGGGKYDKTTLKNPQIFQRKSKDRESIEPVKINIQRDIDAVVHVVHERVMTQEYPKIFENQMDWRLQKLQTKL